MVGAVSDEGVRRRRARPGEGGIGNRSEQGFLTKTSPYIYIYISNYFIVFFNNFT